MKFLKEDIYIHHCEFVELALVDLRPLIEAMAGAGVREMAHIRISGSTNGLRIDSRGSEEVAAAERESTVERIRAAAIQVDVASHGELSMHDLDAILDAEEAQG